MLFLVLVPLIILLSCLIGEHNRQIRDAEIMAEFYRLEYRRAYPTSN